MIELAAYLCLAGFLVFFLAWLVTVLPPDPLSADAERRDMAHPVERHVRERAR
jgi:hypothetical protein